VATNGLIGINLYAAGLSAVEIARLLAVHANTIYAHLHAFDIYGVTAVYRLGKEEPPSRLHLPNSPKCGGWLNYRLMSWASLTGDGHCQCTIKKTAIHSSDEATSPIVGCEALLALVNWIERRRHHDPANIVQDLATRAPGSATSTHCPAARI
jgi:hypothetical protein